MSQHQNIEKIQQINMYKVLSIILDFVGIHLYSANRNVC